LINSEAVSVMGTTGFSEEMREGLLGLITHQQPDTDQALKYLGKSLRRERIGNLTVFIDKTTPSSICNTGLIAEAIGQWSDENQVKADVIETGCLGLISAEPVVGIQVPGRARLYYGPVEPSEPGR
jgi:hypothetical protein